MNAIIRNAAASANRSMSDNITIQLAPNGGPVHLQGDQHLCMQDALGWTVRALTGTAWLTQAGDLRDIVLETGDSFVLDRMGEAVLSPIGETEILIERQSVRPTAQGRPVQQSLVPVFPRVRALFA